jgi:glycerol dehydrogenase-like iron-containing ADH family enzyme
MRVGSFSNAKMNKILDLVGEFSASHRARLSAVVAGEIKDSVDSIVSNRHLIAHGQDVGIGIAAVARYYKSAVKAVEELEKMVHRGFLWVAL